MDILLHLEREVVTIRKEQYLENEQSSSQQKVLSVQTRYYELVQFIEAVPGALLEIIIESLLEIYQNRYRPGQWAPQSHLTPPCSELKDSWVLNKKRTYYN